MQHFQMAVTYEPLNPCPYITHTVCLGLGNILRIVFMTQLSILLYLWKNRNFSVHSATEIMMVGAKKSIGWLYVLQSQCYLLIWSWHIFFMQCKLCSTIILYLVHCWCLPGVHINSGTIKHCLHLVYGKFHHKLPRSWVENRHVIWEFKRAKMAKYINIWWQ